jgi:hypothetical protein
MFRQGGQDEVQKTRRRHAPDVAFAMRDESGVVWRAEPG